MITAMLIYIGYGPKGGRKICDGPKRTIKKVPIAGLTSSIVSRSAFYNHPNDTFYISDTEVTVAQYREFCEHQHIGFPPQPPSTRENNPVVNITWHEAFAFCKWVQGRLPTEREWEYAASAGLSVTYSGANSASKVAIYNKQKPGKVATKLPNQFGLYDMTGNVSEWCSDWTDSSHQWKAVRGGAYNSHISPENQLAIAYRSKQDPDTRTSYTGFRVVWDKR